MNKRILPPDNLVEYIIVHFERLSSHGFHDLFNHYLCFFSKINIMNTAKQKHKTFGIFPEF